LTDFSVIPLYLNICCVWWYWQAQ